jgi:multiple antibiotic resistance protein
MFRQVVAPPKRRVHHSMVIRCIIRATPPRFAEGCRAVPSWPCAQATPQAARARASAHVLGHDARMGADLSFAVVALSAVFFVIDPIANVPVFLTITASHDAVTRRRVARRAAFAAWVILCIFALAGGLIFRAFGISLGAFKIAGGLMLLLMSIDMMRAHPSPTRTTVEEQDESRTREDVAIFPLAMPMLAGPGAIATVMVMMSRAHSRLVPTIAVFVAITITCLVCWLMMRGATTAERFMPKTLLRAFERVMGLLLAAIAVEFIASGVRDMVRLG